jgi:hypothetical protein
MGFAGTSIDKAYTADILPLVSEGYISPLSEIDEASGHKDPIKKNCVRDWRAPIPEFPARLS